MVTTLTLNSYAIWVNFKGSTLDSKKNYKLQCSLIGPSVGSVFFPVRLIAYYCRALLLPSPLLLRPSSVVCRRRNCTSSLSLIHIANIQIRIFLFTLFI